MLNPQAEALRSLHTAHVAKLKEVQLAVQKSEDQQHLAAQFKQVEWHTKLRKQAELFMGSEGEAQRTAAASYIQTRYRSYQAAKAMDSLHAAHASVRFSQHFIGTGVSPG